MKLLLTAAALLVATAPPASASVGYVYQAPSGYLNPPVYGYGYYGGYAPYGYGYGYRSATIGYGTFGYPGYSYYRSWSRPLAPYGFGSPYYSGYNDPYFHTYGPGVQEFLLFGGADFYGW